MDDKIKLYLFGGFWLILIIGSVTGVLVFYTDFDSTETSEEIDYSVSVPDQAFEGEEIEAQLNSEKGEVQGIEVRLDGENIGETDEEGKINYTVDSSGIKNIEFRSGGNEVSESFEVFETSGRSSEDEEQDDEDGLDSSGGESYSGDEEAHEDDADESEDDSSDEDDAGESEDDSSDEEDSQEDDGSNEAELAAEASYSPEEPSVGNQVSFNAEDSTGNIQSYAWSSEDTDLEENSGESITHTFQNDGLFIIELVVENDEGETSETTVELNVEEISETNIFLNEPSQEEKYDSEIMYDFTVKNAEEDAEYTIFINGDENRTESINETGNLQIQETVEVDPGFYDTYVELEQNGDIYQTDEVTVEVEEIAEHQITLDSPKDGETIETFENETEVEFEFTVEDRGDASEITLEIEETEHQFTRPISSGETYNYEFEDIPASEEGETYIWALSTEEGEVSESVNFDLEIVEPEFTIDISSPQHEDQIGHYEVEFEYLAESDVDAEIQARTYAEEDMERTFELCVEGSLEQQTISYDEGDQVHEYDTSIFSDQTLDADFERTHDIQGEYSWEMEISADEEVQKSSQNKKYETQDEPDLDESEEDCGEEEEP